MCQPSTGSSSSTKEKVAVQTRVELLPGLKFTGKMVNIQQFTGKIGKAGKR